MAKRVRTIVTYIDDLTGDELPEGDGTTVQYAWKGKHYEIDLSNHNAAQLDELLSPIIKASRRADTRTLPGAQRPRQVPSEPRALTAAPVDTIEGMSHTQQVMYRRAFLKEVRAWAKENGWPAQAMSGRLMGGVREAWNEANPDRPVPEETKHRG